MKLRKVIANWLQSIYIYSNRVRLTEPPESLEDLRHDLALCSIPGDLVRCEALEDEEDGEEDWKDIFFFINVESTGISIGSKLKI